MRCSFKAFPDISGNDLKSLLYNNKMLNYAGLMEILKANEIRGYSYYTKSNLIGLLIRKCLICENMVLYPKYYFLSQIRSNPRKVEIRDLKTDKVVLYPSIYKAALALDQNTRVIDMYNEKGKRNRYATKVLTEF